MVNLTQVVLIVVITTLTILLTVIGIQVLYILRDIRRVSARVNAIVDHIEAIIAATVRPVTKLGAVVEGIQSSVKLAEFLGLIQRHAKKAADDLPEHVEDFKENIRDAKERIVNELNKAKEEQEIEELEPEPVRHKKRPSPHHLQLPKFFRRSGNSLK